MGWRCPAGVVLQPVAATTRPVACVNFAPTRHRRGMQVNVTVIRMVGNTACVSFTYRRMGLCPHEEQCPFAIAEEPGADRAGLQAGTAGEHRTAACRPASTGKAAAGLVGAVGGASWSFTARSPGAASMQAPIGGRVEIAGAGSLCSGAGMAH